MTTPYKRVFHNGREDWLEFRNKGVGGSEISAIMGLNQYSSPLNVWLEKTERVERTDISDKPNVYWGTVLESVVADEFAKRHPELKVRRENATFVSKKRPWALADIDRAIIDENGRHGVLEIKTCSEYRKDDWENGVPDYYITQPTHYLSVTGWDFFYVAVLIGGNDYREFRYERDEDDIRVVDTVVDAFWNEFVLKDIPPEVEMGNNAEAQGLYEAHTPDNGEFLEMSNSQVPEVGEYMMYAAREGEAKQKRDLYRNKIQAIIGDAKGIITETHRITWNRTEKRNSGLRIKEL